MIMLKLIDIHKTFNPGTINEKVALNGVDLHLNEGDFVTVIGGNGAGKSTMLNAVAGAWPVDSGKIIIGGTDVTKLSEYKRAAYLGRVFQDPMTGTAATMGIEENLALAKRRGKTRLLKPGITKKERDPGILTDIEDQRLAVGQIREDHVQIAVSNTVGKRFIIDIADVIT